MGRGVGFGRGVAAPGPNGVASGEAGKLDAGASVLRTIGSGVTIAIEPFGPAVSVASVFAGSTDPAPSTKFFPLRRICQIG